MLSDSEIEKIWLLSESHVSLPTNSSRVFNQECMFSFATPFDEDGLYVNLKTWRGFGKKYLDYDLSAMGGKAVYVHLMYHRETVSESPEKVSRLAIGTTGGFSGGDNTRVIKSAKILIFSLPEFRLNRPEFHLTDVNVPEPIVEAARAVMDHTGARDQDALKAWEADDARPISKYASSLAQEGKKEISMNPSDWVCEKTGFKDGNLWLNLSDGFIGSGRRNFDGSGGTNGAVDHYQDMLSQCGKNYPLVVKLGTIDGASADVYSYAEDEDMMVTDPLLSEHLAYWGIEVSKMKKSDKTLAEMELELNKDFAFDKIIESGESLVPVSGPGKTGIVNLGNTCYMATVLQLLSHVPEIAQTYCVGDEFLSVGSKILSSSVSDLDVNFFEFSKIVDGLLNAPLTEPIHPSAFRSQFTRNHREFASNHQQDALEFLLHLLKELGRYEHRSSKQVTTEQLFAFDLEERLEVDQQVKYSKRSDTVFPLTVVSPTTDASVVCFEDCLARTIAKVPIEGFKSPTTGSVTDHAFRSFMIATMPQYLLISVNRYYMNDKYQAEKLDCAVAMPEQMDLESIRAKGLQPGETLLEDTPNIEPDRDMVSQLISMGFEDHIVRSACVATNNKDAETALQWILAGNTAVTDPVSDENVMMLTSMGFTEKQAKLALKNTSNNVERAADYLFSHPEVEDVPETKTDDGQGMYDLVGFISHIGKSTAVGHYVCHLKIGADWVMFNDQHVAKSVHPPLNYGYIYMYKRRND